MSRVGVHLRDGHHKGNVLMWFLYELLFVVGLILYLPSAVARRRLPHRGWSMRLGRYPQAVTQALAGRRSLWVHAVSVGEVLAAQPLLSALAEAHPDEPLVVSTITPSGFEVATKRAAGRVVPIYFPLDLRGCVRRALEAIQPRILLLMESELWPVVMHLAKARNIPVAVVNGRVSPRAFARYQLVRRWIGRVFDHVDLFLMQSRTDADRLMQLGVPEAKVRVVGSLKWDASLGSRPTSQEVHETAARLGLNGRHPVIVAGSTHRGEEAAVLKAFQAVRAEHRQARLVLAPRHLERIEEVEGLVHQAGLTAVRLSQAAAGEWDVGIVDAFGQLPRYYSLAAAVFIGGSLIPHGGQNPLEAASLGKPVIFGPSMHNFEAIAHQLLAHHAARQAAGDAELIGLLEELVTDEAEAQAMGRRAQELTERFQGATRRTLDALRPLRS